jgi:hypothetical protein
MLRSEKVDRNTLAELVAGDIEAGSFVNLGIGQPPGLELSDRRTRRHPAHRKRDARNGP